MSSLPLRLSGCALLLLVAGCTPHHLPPDAGEARLPSGGPELYAYYCASCHQPLDKTPLIGRSASRIRSSFVQFPVMAPLGRLSGHELEEISSALTSPSL